MELDFSLLEPIMNELLMNLVFVIGVPLIAVLIMKFILMKLRVPNSIASTLSSLTFLYLAYKMFIVVTQ